MYFKYIFYLNYYIYIFLLIVFYSVFICLFGMYYIMGAFFNIEKVLANLISDSRSCELSF